MATFQHGDHVEHVVDGGTRHRELLAAPVESDPEPDGDA